MKKPTRAPDPPPEVFKRTPEQKAADAARLDAEVKRMIARGESPELERQPGESVARLVGDIDLSGLRERAEKWQAERRALPCWRSVYPAGPPENFLERKLELPQLLGGRLACIAADARDACPYAREEPTCIWNRAQGTRDRAQAYLSAGLGKEAEDEHKLVLASTDLDAPIALRETDPMLVVRAWFAGGKYSVPIVNAAHVAPLTGEIKSTRAIHLAGGERLFVFAGNPGRGKTVAGIYAIARKGGLYVLDYQLARPYEVDVAVGASGVLVIDQIQPSDPDEARYASRRADEIVLRRFAAGRRTLLIGNVDWRTWAARFGELQGGKVKHAGNIAERCEQAGAFVLFGGDSMRSAA